MVMLASSFEDGANQLMLDIASEAGKHIANANPIDTGLSSGNWEGSIGAPWREEQERFYPTASRAAMNNLRNRKKTLRQSVFVSNPVPYVRTLNLFGTSPQANAFWVERSAERGIDSAFKKARVLNG
jgi:hypothetical protein